eukprot:m.56373 g.56373  ORF g.56373 m.56373 type:complete len:302 (-) comp11035_c0_seq1:113-1018(-)
MSRVYPNRKLNTKVTNKRAMVKKMTSILPWLVVLSVIVAAALLGIFYDTNWAISLGTIGGILLTEAILGIVFKAYSRITFDVVQEMGPENAKATLRNVFTNLAVVAALLLTIDVTFLVESPDMDDGEEGLVHAYMAATIMSIILCLRGVLECVTNLLYTEGLTNHDCLRFLIGFPGSIGGPIMSVVLSVLCMAATVFVRMLILYSWAAAGSLAVGTATLILFFAVNIPQKSAFSVDRDSTGSQWWTWAENGSDIPKRLLGMYSDSQIAVIRKKATAAKELETLRQEILSRDKTNLFDFAAT